MVVSWLKHDWSSRHPHTLSLFQQVRLGHVPEDRLKELLDDAKFMKIPGCQQVLEKVLGLIRKLHTSEVSKVELSSKHPDLFATRSTITVSSSTYRVSQKKLVRTNVSLSQNTYHVRSCDYPV